MRVVIAEDQMLLREGLTRLFADHGHDVVAAVGDAQALGAAVGAHSPDLAIVDIRMPPTFTDEGIRTAREIRGLHPDVGILVLSTYAESSYASELLETVRSGVGYLLKDNVTDADALMESLARVAAGETVLDPAIVRRLLGRNRKASLTDALNERELAVLRHMAEGRSNLGIAKELFLSARTVETHVTNVFTKLGLTPSDTENNRVRAVLTFLRSAS
jgi:DNA-binding NarL/FixJ family response regulator